MHGVVALRCGVAGCAIGVAREALFAAVAALNLRARFGQHVLQCRFKLARSDLEFELFGAAVQVVLQAPRDGFVQCQRTDDGVNL